MDVGMCYVDVMITCYFFLHVIVSLMGYFFSFLQTIVEEVFENIIFLFNAKLIIIADY